MACLPVTAAELIGFAGGAASTEDCRGRDAGHGGPESEQSSEEGVELHDESCLKKVVVMGKKSLVVMKAVL